MRKPPLIFDHDPEGKRKPGLRVVGAMKGETVRVTLNRKITGNDDTITLDNFHVRFEDDSVEDGVDEVIQQSVDGEMMAYPLHDKHFSKVFREPDLSKDRFYRYWTRVCLNIELNTGIVIIRTSNRHTRRVSTPDEWVKLLGGSRSSVYQFLNECAEKNYIRCLAKVKVGEKGDVQLETLDGWVINPAFVWYGYSIPKAIHDLFERELAPIRVSRNGDKTFKSVTKT